MTSSSGKSRPRSCAPRSYTHELLGHFAFGLDGVSGMQAAVREIFGGAAPSQHAHGLRVPRLVQSGLVWLFFVLLRQPAGCLSRLGLHRHPWCFLLFVLLPFRAASTCCACDLTQDGALS